MAIVQKITPCLWFDNQAEQAAKFYVSIFNNSGIETITRYGKEGFEKHGKPEGSVLTVTFRLEGQSFTALNRLAGGAREFRGREGFHHWGWRRTDHGSTDMGRTGEQRL